LTTSERVVAIGGMDPSGGAGLVRDFLTAQARGAAAVLIGTAWTDQSRHGVRGFEPRAPDRVTDAIRQALAPSGGTGAVKIGMVATPALVEAILEGLAGFAGPVVFDPVLGASSGGGLFAGEPAGLMPLVRRATLTTPNLGEAAALTGSAVESVEEARRAGRALVAAGAPAVLIKGGHLAGAATDLLVTAGGQEVFSAPRLPGPSPRGTGCALATALAIELGRGRALREAIGTAKSWLHDRIGEARTVGDERHL
jgi:hydroxymethylpyrimidine/phosphomethylpyrimidine kinase